MDYIINFTWDSEANVWIATSNDIPGLVLESGSFDALLERAMIYRDLCSNLVHLTHYWNVLATHYQNCLS